MAIFSGIAAAIGAVSTFAAGFGAIGTFALQTAVGLGLSYAAQALAGKPPEQQAGPGFSIQGKLQVGGTVPRSFLLGTTATAGSLVYANTWGQDGETPNAYLTQVIALSDLPVNGLLSVYVNGIRCTMTTAPPSSSASTELFGEAVRAAIAAGLFPFMGAGFEFVANYLATHGGGEGTGGVNEMGAPLAEYRKDGKDHLWVKFYDGTQTAADSFVASSVSSAERPYGANRIGTGVAYAIVTALVEETLFTGFPSFKFEIQGLKLYDPTKDDTAGGNGAHRYSDPSTWGGDGDNLPAVQLYNLARGLYFGGQWFYGLQGLAAPRLPVTNWQTQIDKCRALVDGPDGPEATYLSGGEVAVSSQVASCFETILTTCQGKLAEIGGFYKLRVGAPDAPVLSFTDGEILSTEEQSFTPFFGLSDTITGITGKHPSPAEAWAVKAAPPLYRADLEELAGNRRLLSDVAFDFVSRDAQAQRLMKSALDSAQRARRHTFSLPPEFWLLEPLDVVEWTSERNGYEAKLMEVDGLVDQANLDVLVDLTEVDPADYDWDQDVDFTSPTNGPVVFVRPAAQAIVDWFAEGVTVEGDTGARRAALFLQWDGNQPDVVGVAFEVRKTSNLQVDHRGRTDNPAAGSIIISQTILPATAYQVRGRYIPGSPRETLWSDWLSVSTPDVRLSEAELEGWIKERITTLVDQNEDKFDDIRAAIQVVADMATKLLRTSDKLKGETSKIADRIELRVGAASASIQETKTLAVNTEAALAEFSREVETELEAPGVGLKARVSNTETSLTTINEAFSDFKDEASVEIFGADGTGTTTGLKASVTAQGTAIAGINNTLGAKYSLTLDVNGYISGYEFINGGPFASAIYMRADKFVIALSGYPGVVPFAVGAIGGVPSIGLTGTVALDGSFHATKIMGGTINGLQIQQDGIPIEKIVQNAVNKVYQKPVVASSATANQWNDVIDTLTINMPVAGVITILGTVGLRSLTTGGGGTSPLTAIETGVNVRALIDSGAYQEIAYKPNPSTSYNFPTNYTCPIAVSEYLTAGVHTVRIQVYTTAAGGPNAVQSYAGGITVIVANKTTLN